MESPDDISAQRRDIASKFNYQYSEDLPITNHVEYIKNFLTSDQQVLILSGATGSGKTTQIPKICLESGLASRRKIVCTQPRRIAARSITKRLAEELGTPYGKYIGCKIRFTDHTSAQTLLKVVTDGILLAEIQQDPMLLEYSVIIVDEAHERSVNIDFLLGYLAELLKKRLDLKIIITSATLDTQKFSQHFNHAPILEIEGRMFPVEIEYRPIDSNLETSGEYSFIDAIESSLGYLLESTPFQNPSDILVFLPTEKDIRETIDTFSKKNGIAARFKNIDILPLYGRLSNAEQDKIFEAKSSRKIILSTNLAETSITIPNIRYVIDTGLARISKYSTQTRTLRLPIEPIAQSSANQRAGRCGRVAPGICIRLYSEQDFLSRPLFSSPEILRANLASVILKMKFLRIGNIHEFPFIDSPHQRTIQFALKHLVELGAIDVEHETITEEGIKIAKIPTDPSIAKMLLNAIDEKVLNEVLIIAAALSVQDPRERPFDEANKADIAHRKFIHPYSDCLTFLNLWNAFHDECERLSQNQLRKFCKSHYLSFNRMREWRDIHHQLLQIVKDLNIFQNSNHTLSLEELYPAIHRSILSGIPSNIGHKIKGNYYQSTYSRKFKIFPGSALHDKKNQIKNQVKNNKASEQSDTSKTPDWILCCQFTETAELYGMIAAKIESRWVMSVAKHLIKISHTEPFFDVEKKSVLVKEKYHLNGLLLDVKSVSYSQVNPLEARDIFIRCGLIEDTIPDQLPFLIYNKQLIEKFENLKTKQRIHTSSYSFDERLFGFYQKNIPSGISNLGDLFKYSRSLKVDDNGHTKLFLKEKDLLESTEEELLYQNIHQYPDAAHLQNTVIPLVYYYNPGDDLDGASISVSLSDFDKLNEHHLDWMIPGYLAEKIQIILKALPKDIRVNLIPINTTAEMIWQYIQDDFDAITQKKDASLTEVVLKVLEKIRPNLKLREKLKTFDYNSIQIPDYLKVRVSVWVEYNKQKKEIAVDRNYNRLKSKIIKYKEDIQKKATARINHTVNAVDDKSNKVWEIAKNQHELKNLISWSFDSYPLFLEIGNVRGVIIKAYPGTMWNQKNNTFSVILFGSYEEAFEYTVESYVKIGGLHIKDELKYLEKDMLVFKQLSTLMITWMSMEIFQNRLIMSIQREIFETNHYLPLSKEKFFETLYNAKQKIKGIIYKFFDALKIILELRQNLSIAKKQYPKQSLDLSELFSVDFFEKISLFQLQQIPRYLKAMQIRAEKYIVNPAKDEQLQKTIDVYEKQYLYYLNHPKLTFHKRQLIYQLYWMLQEYKVSIFAQQLGTAQKVSIVRLDGMLEQLKNEFN